MMQPADGLYKTAIQAFERSDLTSAQRFAEDALAQSRKHVPSMELLGQIAFANGDYPAAVTHLKRCISIESRNPRPYLILAELRTHQGMYREAISAYDRVLKIDPSQVRAVAGKADAFEKRGDRKKARILLTPFVDAGTDTPEMAVVHCRIDLHENRHDAVVDLATRHLAAEPTAAYTRWHLQFLLGKAYERSDRIDKAFKAYRDANAAVPAHFDLAAWQAQTDMLIESFSAERMATLPRATIDTSRPILIVGLPRSGSTLVESILDAHPQIHAAGETPELTRLALGMNVRLGSDRSFPLCIDELDQTTTDAMATEYLDHLRTTNRKAIRVVDKFLTNFRWLGLAQILLPQATVIWCTRDPMNQCFSCYGEPLPTSAHGYTADLTHLGSVFRDTEKMMAHWQTVLDQPILKVNYEALIADQEQESRRILDHCGLPWDDACMRFHENTRIIRTASYDQANRPVYSTSVDRASRFAEYLAPLRAALDAAVHSKGPSQ